MSARSPGSKRSAPACPSCSTTTRPCTRTGPQARAWSSWTCARTAAASAAPPRAENSAARLITQGELLGNVSDPDGPTLTATGLAIASGAYDLVVVVGVEKVTDVLDGQLEAGLALAGDADWEAVHGATMTAQWAMLMRRYMHQYGYEAADFAAFPVNAHANGAAHTCARRSLFMRVCSGCKANGKSGRPRGAGGSLSAQARRRVRQG